MQAKTDLKRLPVAAPVAAGAARSQDMACNCRAHHRLRVHCRPATWARRGLFGLLQDQRARLIARDVQGTQGGGGGIFDLGVRRGAHHLDQGGNRRVVKGIAGALGRFG